MAGVLLFTLLSICSSSSGEKCATCHHHHAHTPPPDAHAIGAGPRTVPFLAEAPISGVDVASRSSRRR